MRFVRASSSLFMFQSTRPRGARPVSPAARSHFAEFQSTRPRGARRPMFHRCARLILFQSTRPRGARHPCGADAGEVFEVSIHAPARGATSSPPCTSLYFLGFNPRARAGRDRVWSVAMATSARVSIHAPARGATRWMIEHEEFKNRFNPRARAGRDAHTPHYREMMRGVSIHAPARGATTLQPQQQIGPMGFNPRARAGRDAIVATSPEHAAWFQSTRPRGARRDRGTAPGLGSRVSIHAPARGATMAAWSGKPITSEFQSTRPRGARRTRRGGRPPARQCFNPRARAGRDVAAYPHMLRSIVSIHAPARGATLPCRDRMELNCFNPRARAGRDIPT